MRIVLIVVMSLISLVAVAQSNMMDPSDSSVLKQQGKIFTFQILPGEPVRFFVVGREEAKIDLSNLAVTVRRLKPYPGQVLTLSRKDDYFVAEDDKELKDAIALEVTAKASQKIEKMRFQLKREEKH